MGNTFKKIGKKIAASPRARRRESAEERKERLHSVQTRALQRLRGVLAVAGAFADGGSDQKEKRQNHLSKCFVHVLVLVLPIMASVRSLTFSALFGMLCTATAVIMWLAVENMPGEDTNSSGGGGGGTNSKIKLYVGRPTPAHPAYALIGCAAALGAGACVEASGSASGGGFWLAFYHASLLFATTTSFALFNSNVARAKPVPAAILPPLAAMNRPPWTGPLTFLAGGCAAGVALGSILARFPVARLVTSLTTALVYVVVGTLVFLALAGGGASTVAAVAGNAMNAAMIIPRGGGGPPGSWFVRGLVRLIFAPFAIAAYLLVIAAGVGAAVFISIFVAAVVAGVLGAVGGSAGGADAASAGPSMGVATWDLVCLAGNVMIATMLSAISVEPVARPGETAATTTTRATTRANRTHRTPTDAAPSPPSPPPAPGWNVEEMQQARVCAWCTAFALRCMMLW